MRFPLIFTVLGLFLLSQTELYAQNKRLERAYDTYEAG